MAYASAIRAPTVPFFYGRAALVTAAAALVVGAAPRRALLVGAAVPALYAADQHLWSAGLLLVAAILRVLGPRDGAEAPPTTRLAESASTLGLAAVSALHLVAARAVVPRAPWAPLVVGGGLSGLAWAAAPTRRRPAAVVMLLSALFAAFELGLPGRLDALPLEEAARAAALARSEAGYLAVERRAAEVLHDVKAPWGAVIAMAPRRPATGAAVARAHGADAALDAGFEPVPPLPSDVGRALAASLQRRGEAARALRLLRAQPRDGETSWALAKLAAAEGDRALAARALTFAAVPDAAARAPGVVLRADALLDGTPRDAEVLLPAGTFALEVTARGEGSPPPLLRVRAADQTFEVPFAGVGRWVSPPLRGPLAFDLRIALVNDDDGPEDRNLWDVVVTATAVPAGGG